MYEMNTTLKGNMEKGIYAHHQTDGFLSVREFIIMASNESNRRCLLVRYANESAFEINCFDFLLTQFDTRGNVIKREKIKYENLAIAPSALYSPEKGIVIEDNCADFTIKMLSIASGRYTYVYRRGQITAHYSLEEPADAPVEVGVHADYLVRHRYRGGTKFYKFVAAVSLAMIFLTLAYMAFSNVQ